MRRAEHIVFSIVGISKRPINFYRCPLALCRYPPFQRVNEYLKLWRLREKGILPRSGGWYEQEYLYTQVMELLDIEMARIEKEST